MFELFNQVGFRKFNNSDGADFRFVYIRNFPVSLAVSVFICFSSLSTFPLIPSRISLFLSYVFLSSFYSSPSSGHHLQIAHSVKRVIVLIILSSLFIIKSLCSLYSPLSLLLFMFLLGIPRCPTSALSNYLSPSSPLPPSLPPALPRLSTLNKPSIIKQTQQVPTPFDFCFAGRRPRPPSCNLLPLREVLLLRCEVSSTALLFALFISGIIFDSLIIFRD